MSTLKLNRKNKNIMTDETDISMYSTDASFSWNGYSYQGKVALFVALKKIEELNAENVDLNEYFLELEWLEDFSIKKNNEYITVHQVKTYNTSTVSKYKNAIWTLLFKLLEFPTLEKAYLHTTNDLEIPKDFSEKHAINEPNKPAKNPKIKSPYESYIGVVESGKYDSVVKRFKMYNYGNQENEMNFCSFDDIEKKIKEKVIGFAGNNASDERIDRAYLALLGLVDSNIKERHKDIQEGVKKEKVSIKFVDIKKIVEKNHDLPSKEYTIYYMKDKFQRMATNYINEVLEEEYNMDYVSKDSYDLFKTTIDEVFALNDNEFYEFCLKISPDNEVTDEDDNEQMKFLTSYLPKQGMENCFFEIIKQVQRKVESKKWVFHKRINNNKNIVYLPSTILDDNSPIKNNLLIKRINNNDNLDLLREVEKIITKNITSGSIDENVIYRNIPDPDVNDRTRKNEQYHDRITVMKKISLIMLDEAKEELK